MGHFDKKNKLIGKNIYKVSNVNKSGGLATATVISEFFDKKDKIVSQTNGEMKCRNGQLLIDMKMLLSPQQTSQFQNADAKGKVVSLEYPTKISVGQTLTDGFFDMDMKTESGISANIKLEITNRKVDTKESVTTPAGTWDAYRISYNARMVLNMGFAVPIKIEGTEWFVPDFGVVKTESKSGKSELLSIE
ncbi:MAG: hypothetical protein IPH58_06805 [Sphingobacteriales bacterium]|jgi:uncharacterized protein with gpF-like domain|nr:hypothetical protein [Sphingobacteriales bacterium]